MCSMKFYNLCKHLSMTKLNFIGQTYLAYQPQRSSSRQGSLPCLNVLLSKDELTTFTSWEGLPCFWYKERGIKTFKQNGRRMSPNSILVFACFPLRTNGSQIVGISEYNYEAVIVYSFVVWCLLWSPVCWWTVTALLSGQNHNSWKGPGWPGIT